MCAFMYTMIFYKSFTSFWIMFNRFFFSLIFISGCDQKFTNCRTAELYENPNIKAFFEKKRKYKTKSRSSIIPTYVCIKLKTVHIFFGWKISTHWKPERELFELYNFWVHRRVVYSRLPNIKIYILINMRDRQPI